MRKLRDNYCYLLLHAQELTWLTAKKAPRIYFLGYWVTAWLLSVFVNFKGFSRLITHFFSCEALVLLWMGTFNQNQGNILTHKNYLKYVLWKILKGYIHTSACVRIGNFLDILIYVIVTVSGKNPHVLHHVETLSNNLNHI